MIGLNSVSVFVYVEKSSAQLPEVGLSANFGPTMMGS